MEMEERGTWQWGDGKVLKRREEEVQEQKDRREWDRKRLSKKKKQQLWLIPLQLPEEMSNVSYVLMLMRTKAVLGVFGCTVWRIVDMFIESVSFVTLWVSRSERGCGKRREGSHFKIWEGQRRARWIINKIYDEFFLSEMPGVCRNADHANLKWMYEILH